MDELIETLKELGALRTSSIIEAFSHIDRRDFIRPENIDEAYENYPLSIGFGQTISQPYTVAFMLELLNPNPGNRVLDVGSGSGWTTALIAYIVGEKGLVYGTEIIPELAVWGAKNLTKYHFKHSSIHKAESVLGYPAGGPYDKILVSAAGNQIPEILINQLAPGGTMVIPIKNALWQIKKNRVGATTTNIFDGFVFVPLITK